MDNSNAASQALPGSPDLDGDIHGLVLTSVAAVDDSREILLRVEGGRGRWADAGDSRGYVTVTGVNLDLSARAPSMPDALWAGYVATLERWRDDRTRLRMCSAPGKATLLIAAPDDFLPFPPGPNPGGDDHE